MVACDVARIGGGRMIVTFEGRRCERKLWRWETALRTNLPRLIIILLKRDANVRAWCIFIFQRDGTRERIEPVGAGVGDENERERKRDGRCLARSGLGGWKLGMVWGTALCKAFPIRCSTRFAWKIVWNLFTPTKSWEIQTPVYATMFHERPLISDRLAPGV